MAWMGGILRRDVEGSQKEYHRNLPDLFCCPKVLKFLVRVCFLVPLGTLQKYFYTPIGLIQKRKRISYDSLGRGVDDEHEIS